MARGAGFIIASAALIPPNRHVAKGGRTFDVVLQGGKPVNGEVIAMDEEQDLALVRIKVARPLKVAELAAHDSPGDGADCTVIGFPLGDRFSSAPKVTHGIVT